MKHLNKKTSLIEKDISQCQQNLYRLKECKDPPKILSTEITKLKCKESNSSKMHLKLNKTDDQMSSSKMKKNVHELSVIKPVISDFTLKLDKSIKEVVDNLKSIDTNSILKILINDLSNMKNFTQNLSEYFHKDNLRFERILKSLDIIFDDDQISIEALTFLQVNKIVKVLGAFRQITK